MIRFLANNERGAVTVDWVALTAGLLFLGIIAVYAVMVNSADGLLDQFDVVFVFLGQRLHDVQLVITDAQPAQVDS